MSHNCSIISFRRSYFYLVCDACGCSFHIPKIYDEEKFQAYIDATKSVTLADLLFMLGPRHKNPHVIEIHRREKHVVCPLDLSA